MTTCKEERLAHKRIMAANARTRKLIAQREQGKEEGRACWLCHAIILKGRTCKECQELISKHEAITCH